MDGCFLKQFLRTIRPKQCACLEKSMDDLKCEIIQSQVTFKSIQILLKSIPPDLRIICEDKMEFSSHKLLFGLMNTTLASIFLEDEFINEMVTLVMPTVGEHLEAMLNDEFMLKSKLEEIFSTSLHCPTGSRDVIKYLNESRSIELIMTEGRHKFKEEEEDESIEPDMGSVEEGDMMPNPVRISFKKQERKERKKLLQIKKGKKTDHNPVPCEDCGKMCQDSRALYNHRKYHQDQNPVPCEDCGKMCRNSRALNNHKKYHHEITEQVLQKCDKCDYSTFHKAALYAHIKNHHDSQKVQCTECGKSFFGHKLYKAHVERMHMERGNEVVQCKECGKQFPKYRLKIHIRLMHKERKFACHLCTYKAQTNYNLRLHINKTHLGIKEFPKHKCPHCDIDTTNLDWHIKVHHKNII